MITQAFQKKEGVEMAWKETIKAIITKFWGLVPLLVVLLCVGLVAAIQALTGDTLRSVPRTVLMGLGMCSIAVALLWANIRLIFAEIPVPVLSPILKIVTPILSCVFVVYLGIVSMVVMVFSYCPEHVVMYRGTKMVASVNSFVDINVTYYRYKNALFYGERRAEEWHGSGSHDPFEYEENPTPKSWTIYDEQGNVVEWGPK